MLLLPSLIWLSDAEFPGILLVFLLFWSWPLSSPVGAGSWLVGNAQEAGEGGRVGGGRSMAALGSAPKRAIRSRWEGG